ncbi:MAG: hypothetical protein ABWZ74_04445 [Hyphomicrobiaceae bacterium]
MKRIALLLTVIALATPAVAQRQLSELQTHRFSSSETGALASVEIQTVKGDRGRMIFALRAGDEAPATLAYADDIRVKDATYVGNERTALVPGSTRDVSLFQMMPGATHRYSAAIAGLCSGKGVPFVGIEPSKGSVRQGSFDHTSPVRLYVIEETYQPGKIAFTLCKAIDLRPAN